MKATGMVRKVDDLGRVVIPKELRQVLNIELRDPMEIFVNGEQIIFQKYQPACIFCESADQITVFRGRNICAGCLRKLKEIR